MSVLAAYAKAVGGALPGAGRLPGLPGGTSTVPGAVLEARGVTTDLERLAAYDRVCGFTLRDAVPATWPHVHAFELQMQLMTRGDFPLSPLGLVHVTNRIVQHRPIALGEAFDLSVRATPLEPHPSGRQFTLVSEARVADELVWEDASTYLARGGGSGGGERAKGARRAAVPPVQRTWRLPGGLGRRYAGVSGDRNPIHLNPYTAKAFGFPRAIAHGMWTKARCLAALERELPDAYAVEVSFRKPILLPGSVGFGRTAAKRGGRIDFAVQDTRGKGTLHLQGSITRP